jgi:hypothetical protein
MAETEKRPHAFSICILLLALVVSAFSAYLSYRALTLNQEWNRETQRAYITSQNFQMEPELEAGKRVMDFKADVYNGGNTPATKLCVVTNAYIPDMDIATRSYADDPAFVGPKDKYTILFPISLPPEALDGSGHVRHTIYIAGEIHYDTVFEHGKRWKWCVKYGSNGVFHGCDVSKFKAQYPPDLPQSCKS